MPRAKLSQRRPKFSPIYDRLRESIEKGDYPVGTILPTEEQLADTFGVSRYTLREAVGLLEKQGFVQRKRRAGTKILSGAPAQVFRHASNSKSELMEFVSGTVMQFTPPITIVTDGRLARALGCDELREWYLLEGVRTDLTDKAVIGISQVYVDASRTELPANGDFDGKPVYQWLSDTSNIRAAVVSQDITAVALNPHEAEVFQERVGAPALKIVRRYFDQVQRMFEISVTTHRSEGFVYNTRLQLE